MHMQVQPSLTLTPSQAAHSSTEHCCPTEHTQKEHEGCSSALVLQFNTKLFCNGEDEGRENKQHTLPSRFPGLILQDTAFVKLLSVRTPTSTNQPYLFISTFTHLLHLAAATEQWLSDASHHCCRDGQHPPTSQPQYCSHPVPLIKQSLLYVNNS